MSSEPALPDEVKSLISECAERLRQLAPNGEIPAGWRRAVAKSLESRRGLKPTAKAGELARAEFDRGMAVESGKSSMTQEALAGELRTDPRHLRRVEAKFRPALISEELCRRLDESDRENLEDEAREKTRRLDQLTAPLEEPANRGEEDSR
jgi:hypothetical protein